MNNEELKLLQNLPLELKIAKSKLRIREFIKQIGEENVYISFSGGKDSTVLLNLIRQEFQNIVAVYCDTGLEYPEVKKHVKSFDNITIIRPKMSFKQVIDKYGYPVISKEQSKYIYDARHSTPYIRNLRIHGNKKGQFKISNKWLYMLDSPFEISNKCCDELKKKPFKKYEKETGRHKITGVMANESNLRTQQYIKNGGCNSFKGEIQSQPLGFWREQDILEYIYKFNLKIPSVYGEIRQTSEGIYYTTGVNRTGCIFCMYGIHLEKGENRFQKLYKTHPKLWDYCMKTLKIQDVCNYMCIPTIPTDVIEEHLKIIK